MLIQHPRNPATEKVTFKLQARSPGAAPVTREIRADFWLDNSCIGGLKYTVTILPEDYSGSFPTPIVAQSETLRFPRARREDCDLAIRVLRDRRAGVDAYNIEFRSAVPGRSYESKSVGGLWLDGKDLETYLSELLDPQFAKYPLDPLMKMTDDEYGAAIASWNLEFSASLKDLGRRLGQQLSEEFRDEYFKLQKMEQPPRAIAIYSDETIFPWELVVPWSEEEELSPLGITHILGRWKPSLALRPDPQKFRLQTFVVMNPQYGEDNLAWTRDEIAELAEIVPGLGILRPCDMPAVQRLLERMDVQLLHFSGHGFWSQGSNGDLAAIQLEDGTRLLAVSLLGRRIGRGKPILYLNACTVGRAGLVLGRSGGFVGNCIESGWSGVIAPYWPINDASAKDFATAFIAV
jgi:hypothetical protein